MYLGEARGALTPGTKFQGGERILRYCCIYFICPYYDVKIGFVVIIIVY